MDERAKGLRNYIGLCTLFYAAILALSSLYIRGAVEEFKSETDRIVKVLNERYDPQIEVIREALALEKQRAEDQRLRTDLLYKKFGFE